VLAAGHAVGDHGAEQRFDGAQHGDGKCRGQQLADQFEGQRQGLAVGAGQAPGQGQVRQERRDAGVFDAIELIAEALAECRHGQPELFQGDGQQCAKCQGDQVRGDFRHQARPDQQRCQGRCADQAVARLQAGQGLRQQLQLFQQVMGCAGQVQAEQVLDLQDGDDDADAGGKAQCHRVGHELDQASGAQQSQGDQNGSGEHRAQQQAAQAVLLGNRQEDHHEGGRGAADVEARATAQSDQRRRDQDGVEAVLGCHTHGDGQRHGQRNGDDADRQAGAQVATQGLPRITGAPGLAPGGEQR
jgi:hypothetical protein